MPIIPSPSKLPNPECPLLSPKRRKDITVYLTGFGPFKRISDNPSSQIASSFLPAGSTTIHFIASNDVEHVVNIHAHPEPIKVAYKTVDNVVPKIWAREDWDYILHLGVGSEGGYEVETIAHELGYVKKDIDGLTGKDEKEACALKFEGVHGAEVQVKGSGHVYATSLDVAYIVESVQSMHSPIDGDRTKIKPSTDAGMYLCEYIFRASLMEAEKRGSQASKRVLFVHVPPKGKPYTVETGIEVVKQIVEAMVRDGEDARQHFMNNAANLEWD